MTGNHLSYNEVHMEVTTYCNFRCPFCPLGALRRPTQHMPLEHALAAVEEIGRERLAPQVAYHLMGEPLLHPEIGVILAAGKKAGLINRVVTNGFLLNRAPIRTILSLCDVLDISLRATDEASYQALSAPGTFAGYLAGIQGFLTRRKYLGVPLVRLRVFAEPNWRQVETWDKRP